MCHFRRFVKCVLACTQRERNAASVKLQATWRGYSARKRFRERQRQLQLELEQQQQVFQHEIDPDSLSSCQPLEYVSLLRLKLQQLWKHRR